MTTTAFRPLTAAETIFRDLVFKPAILAGEKALETAVPALALPVINQIEEGVLNDLADWVYSNIVLLIDIETIVLVNDTHQEAFNNAAAKLQIIALDWGINSKEFADAKAIEAAAFIKFVHFAGS